MDGNVGERKKAGFSLRKIRRRTGRYDVQAVEKAAFGNGEIGGSRHFDDKFAEYKANEHARLGRLFGDIEDGSLRGRPAVCEDSRFMGSSETMSSITLSSKEEAAGGYDSSHDHRRDGSEEDRFAANDHEEPKKSGRGVARFRFGSNRAKGKSRGSVDVIEGSGSEEGINAAEQYSSASEEEPKKSGRGVARFRFGSNRAKGKSRGSVDVIEGSGSEEGINAAEQYSSASEEEPKKSGRGVARFRFGSNRAKGKSRGSVDVIEGSASEEGINAAEQYSSASEEELPIRAKEKAASRSVFRRDNRSFIDFDESVVGSSNTMSGDSSEYGEGSRKGRLHALVALKGLVNKVKNRVKAQLASSDDDNIYDGARGSRFHSLKRSLQKKRNKVPESVVVTEEKEKEKGCFFHFKETGLGVAAVCACISAMAIVFKVYNKTRNKGGVNAYIACVLATVIGVALAVAVLHYCVPRVADKTKTQGIFGKKGLDIFKKDCLFWVIEFNKGIGVRYGYPLTKKMAAKSVPTKHLGFNNNGKLLFKGVSVPEKVCTTYIVLGDKCSAIMKSGGYAISRIHFRDQNSMTFMRRMCSVIGKDKDLRDYLTFRTVKGDIQDAYRFSACFKYRFADRETYIHFALAMAQAGCSELLIAYLSSFMPKVSYARGDGCNGLALRFMKTKEWRLLCFDEAKFGLVSKISTYCKREIIEDQRKFLKCFLDAYSRCVSADSKRALRENNSPEGAACVRVEKGPGFPFSNPRYVLALNRVAKECGARVEEDVYTGYRAFIKDENMQFGFASAVFVKGGTIDCVYDYSDKYCTRETVDTYLSNMRKEQVYRGWRR